MQSFESVVISVFAGMFVSPVAVIKSLMYLLNKHHLKETVYNLTSCMFTVCSYDDVMRHGRTKSGQKSKESGQGIPLRREPHKRHIF